EAVAAGAVLERRVAEAIIGGALVAVLEDVVGLVELLEAVLAFLVARVAVRVVLHGELAERGLELDLGGRARDAQYLVIVALGHASASPPRLPCGRSRRSPAGRARRRAACLVHPPCRRPLRASAAVLKFLHHLPQARLGTSNRKAALEP